MYVWGLVYKTRWTRYGGFVWSHLEVDDELLYPLAAGAFAPAELLLEVSAAMREAGFNGAFRQVPEECLKARPEILKSFDAVQVPEEVGEYVYSVEKLAALGGGKLAKKKNLIAQFKRANPDAFAKPLETADIPACVELERKWRREKVSGLPLELEHEDAAIEAAFKDFAPAGFEGVAAYAGGKLAAFSMFSRVSDSMFTEHFEKADPSVKGAAQFINNETAKALLGRAELINREQDMGLDGLRQAKRSYDPLYLVRNYSLTPRA
jgi:hypothetical protein